MTSAHALLITIAGSTGMDLRPLAYSMDAICELFMQKIPLEDIQFARQVYAVVANFMARKTSAIAKSVQRTTKLCWDNLIEKGPLDQYIGCPASPAPAPGYLAAYLAFYDFSHIPYFKAVEQNPSLLFTLSPPPSSQSPHLSDLRLAEEVLSATLSRWVPQQVRQVMVYPTTSFPICPGCTSTLEWEYQNFCDRCGQQLLWDDFDDAEIVYPGSHRDTYK